MTEQATRLKRQMMHLAKASIERRLGVKVTATAERVFTDTERAILEAVAIMLDIHEREGHVNHPAEKGN